MTSTLGNPVLDRLDAERQQIDTRLQGTLDDAAGDERDLTDDEQVKVRAWRERLEQIDGQVELIGGALTTTASAASRLAALPAAGGRAPREDQLMYRSGGELLYDLLHQGEGDRRERYRAVLTRAAQHMGTDKAATTTVAGDLGGLHVDPVVGPVFRPDPNIARLTYGLGAQIGPAAFSFARPYIVDADTPTAPDVQTAQKAEVASRAFEVDADTLKYATVAQYINISQQLLSWQPGSLGVIMAQMRRRQGKALDARVFAALDATTSSITLESDGDAAAIQAALGEACKAVEDATDADAEWLAVGTEAFYRLAWLPDAAGRPMFPVVNPSNALGGAGMMNVQMLRVVKSRAIADGAMYVGNGVAFEVYLSELPVLEAIEPSVLGRQVALGVGVVAHVPTDLANAVQKVQDDTP